MSKKTFKDTIREKAAENPALQFISQPLTEEPEEEAEEKIYRTGSGNRPNTQPGANAAGETKSRRLQLLLTPSLYAAIRDKAAAERRSVNDTINIILQDAISE